MEKFHFIEGRGPLLVSIPHAGTYVPENLARRLTPEALLLPDTDWHVPRLYDFLEQLGANVLIATHSRYVVDLNRAPDGRVLYPGASNTEVCPTALFNERPIYLDGEKPGPTEVAARCEEFWSPYHRLLATTLQRLRAQYGVAMLFDAHSIRSEVPRFFKGRLPDLNIGTGSGSSARAEIGAALLRLCAACPQYSAVLNGRFTGGYITRHYGEPSQGIHAVQLELSQRTYMQEEHPYAFDEAAADRLRPLLQQLLAQVLATAAQ